jgi:hypothetical protein
MDSIGRGPDPLVIELDGFRSTLRAARELEPKLEQVVGELNDRRRRLSEEHGVHIAVDFGRPFSAALGVLAGEPFWERPEPVA